MSVENIKQKPSQGCSLGIKMSKCIRCSRLNFDSVCIFFNMRINDVNKEGDCEHFDDCGF